MYQSNPLESIFYIEIPQNFTSSETAFKINPSIKLPVQKKNDEMSGSFSPSDITTEQILAGILTVFAYDKKNENLDYYRSIIKNVKPNIKKELCEAAILKTKNGDFDLAEEIFLALLGFDPDDIKLTLNMALFLDQRADSYRNSGLLEDAQAYDNDAFCYYQQAMNWEPALPEAFFNAGFFFMKNHKYRDAKDSFETYLALTCDISDEEMGENGVYRKERAQEIINNINNQNIDDEDFRAAYELINQDKVEEGLEKIRSFLETNPKVWNAWFMLGWGLRKIFRFRDAISAFNESLKCSGGEENCDTFNELSLCYVQEKEFTEANNCLLKAISIEPENTKVISNLGYLSLIQGDKESAQKYFSIVLEIDSKDKFATNELLKLEKGE